MEVASLVLCNAFGIVREDEGRVARDPQLREADELCSVAPGFFDQGTRVLDCRLDIKPALVSS